MKYMVTPDNIRANVKRGGLSVRRSVADEFLREGGNQTRPHNLAAVYEQIRYALPLPRSTDYIELSLNIIQPEIDRMIRGDLTPEQAARNATAPPTVS
jgi:ABC-type glycerol-3-phosphate transport system substrate-binding protein